MLSFLISDVDIAELEDQLDQEVADYRSNVFAKSTQKTYDSHRKSYINFCLKMGYPAVPVSQLNLQRYIAYIARRLKPQSVTKYVNIIRLLHLEAGLPNPLEDNWYIKSLLTGIKRSKGQQVNRKLPITPELLLRIRQCLSPARPEDIIFWALALLGFFSLLRKSHFLPTSRSSFDPEKMVTRRDFTVRPWGLELNIKASKTIQFKERTFQVPLLALPGHPLCPVTAILRAFALTPSADPSGPAFLLPTLLPMVYNHFVKKLRLIMQQLGFPPEGFAGHSFRRGGASWGFRVLLPSEAIKALGDWNSDAYLTYLEIPMSSKVSHARTFSNNLPTTLFHV